MLRSWGVKGLMVPYLTVENFTLTGAASYTIGSAGTFNTVRPARIDGAYLRTSGAGDTPLNIIGPEKYRSFGDKSLAGTGNWLFYNPVHPLGVIYINPLSSDTLYLHSYKQLTEPAALATDTGFPPEYDAAIRWNLALQLSPEFGREPPQSVIAFATDALNSIKAHNAAIMAMDSVKNPLSGVGRGYSITQDG